jgi:enoyl-CoA hydratase
MADDVIKVATPETGILQISLNRPQQRNALNHDMLAALFAICERARVDGAIKAILLTGEGSVFCAGADIKGLIDLDSQSGYAFAKYGQAVFQALESLGKPSLAAIRGFAFGGGAELAMAATMRIATNTAQFAQPEIKLGVIPGFGGTQRLARLVGKGRALDLCLSGKHFSAAQAYEWGFLSAVTSETELLEQSMTVLRQFVSSPSQAMYSILTAIHGGYDLSLEDSLELEAAQFGLCCATEEKREGVSAFLEKRVPVFRGTEQ